LLVLSAAVHNEAVKNNQIHPRWR